MAFFAGPPGIELGKANSHVQIQLRQAVHHGRCGLLIALHKLPVCRELNLTATLRYLKESGFRIIAATEKGDYNYTEADYSGPLCIIMGAEDKGVSYDNLALCDEWVKIPMRGTIESLNVSVAAGILIYEAIRGRGETI